MSIEQNVLAPAHWFSYEDKKLRFLVFDEDDVTPLNVTGMTFVWTLSDDPEGTVEIVKTSAAGQITIGGVFNIDPQLNTQYVEVTVTAEDTDVLFKGKHYYSLRRADVGFRNVVTFGYWLVQKAAKPTVV